ncbi:MAG: DUF934 domain-containing protein [Parvibaculales bacterium]
MKLLKQGKIIKDDWHHIADGEDIGEHPAIIPLKRFCEEEKALKGRNAPLGVLVKGGEKTGDDIRTLAPFLDRIALVAIEFPIFKNGRGFSNARILREELGFTGEIRAVGEVLRDQLLFMMRCGIDSYEIDERVGEKDWQEAIAEFSDFYQPAGDKKRGVLWQRKP